MKLHEQEIRDLIGHGVPFTIVVHSADRIRVASHDHIFIAPLKDEAGEEIDDAKRSDFFQVWGDGRHYRFVAFALIALLETDAPISA